MPGLKSTSWPRLRNTDSHTGSVESPIKMLARAGRELPTRHRTLSRGAPCPDGLALRPAAAPARTTLCTAAAAIRAVVAQQQQQQQQQCNDNRQPSNQKVSSKAEGLAYLGQAEGQNAGGLNSGMVMEAQGSRERIGQLCLRIGVERVGCGLGNCWLQAGGRDMIFVWKVLSRVVVL